MRAHPGSFADEPLTRKAARYASARVDLYYSWLIYRRLTARFETSVPVYAGSPRMLLAIPNANVDKDVPSYFGLVTARPSATLTYTLSIDPDMRFISTLLPEHACFCTTDVVPGMDTRDMIAITASNSVAVAEFEVDFAAELEAAEAAFLREFSNACGVHAVDCTDTNAAPPMEIIERRLIVALHNGRTFIGTPTVIALQESPDFDNLLRFPGSIALDRWPAADGIAVVFALEYAVAVTGGREMTGRKSWFSRSAPPAGLTMSGGGEAVRENERRVCLGWAAWVPDDRRTGMA